MHGKVSHCRTAPPLLNGGSIMKKLLTLVLFLSTTAFAAQPNQTSVTLPDGVVVKKDLPGTLRGNPNSDKPGNNKKVYVCHATSAVKNNGYVMIHVGNPAGKAHLDHEHATPNGNGQAKKARDLVGVDPSFETCSTAEQGSS